MAASTRTGAGWVASLRRRLASALFLIPLVIVLVWLGGWYAFGGIVLVLFVGALELRYMCGVKGWRPLISLSLALSVLFLLAAMQDLQAYRLLLIEVGMALLAILPFLFILFRQPIVAGTAIDWALTVAIPFYLGWPFAFLLLLRGSEIGYQSRGFWWMLLILLTVWANDAAAYLAGHYWGRTKLAPAISPAKTWEGFVGGLALSIVAVIVVTSVADLVLTRPLHVPWYFAILLGALICGAATLGDLAESLLKRATGVKDSGWIVPGHGGILDRADSLLFASIVVYFFALAAGTLH